MSFEALANEIILDLFEYFDAIHLFHAFSHLNNRFDQLLLSQQQQFSLDFRSISRQKFQRFCQQHLTSVVDRVTSLHLSDDIETPNLPQILLLNGYQINRFRRLQSLTIHQTDSFDLIKEITSQCRELQFLTHLSVPFKYDPNPQKNIDSLINTIWSLANLTHCSLEFNYPHAMWPTNMSIVSNSIEYLSTKNITHSSYTLPQLLQNTPYLQCLHIGKIEQYDELPKETIYPLLHSITMTVDSSVELMSDLLGKFPNLSSLKLTLEKFSIGGGEMERMLRTYCINLKIFHFQMLLNLSASSDVQQSIDSLVNTFRSDFWIHYHQWFVRCDWDPNDGYDPAHLYTLPYSFNRFSYTDGCQSQTTDPNGFNSPPSSSSYERVDILHYINQTKNYKEDERVSMQFINIRHLKIRLPVPHKFWSVIPTLDHLVSLDVTLSDDSGYSQLQTLLNRATQLYAIHFRLLYNFSMSSLNIQSTSIRRMEFSHRFGYYLNCFIDQDYTILARSSLGCQCQVLKIDVDNQTKIQNIMRSMPHLRALTVQCKEKLSITPNGTEANLIRLWLCGS